MRNNHRDNTSQFPSEPMDVVCVSSIWKRQRMINFLLLWAKWLIILYHQVEPSWNFVAPICRERICEKECNMLILILEPSSPSVFQISSTIPSCINEILIPSRRRTLVWNGCWIWIQNLLRFNLINKIMLVLILFI